MRNHPHDRSRQDSIDQMQERTQRDQEERSRQALSNQGSQDRRPDPSVDNPKSRDHAKGQSPP